MIDPICFEEPWLRDVKSKINPAVDIVLLERMIYAFELLGQITKVKNDFIFKGGTSLVLLIPEVKRLSIDIDVVGEFTEDELLPVIENSIFNELAEDIRENTEIPKKHWKFFYNSKLDDIERYILLDILGSDNPYSNVIESVISNPLFNTVEELKVKTPSIDDILGDKLTAFAPHTIGIPFGINKALEIIKQLYDINNLFDLLSDIKVVNSAYKNISENESGYRGLSSDLQVHLIDSFQTSAKLCRLDFKGSVEDDETIELRKGIRAISGFLLNNDFNFSTAKTAASKVALLSSLLKFPDNKINFNDLRFDDTKLKVLKDFQLPPELNLLNTLKRTNIEAFYYWYLITKITEDLSWIDL